MNSKVFVPAEGGGRKRLVKESGGRVAVVRTRANKSKVGCFETGSRKMGAEMPNVVKEKYGCLLTNLMYSFKERKNSKVTPRFLTHSE